MEYRQLITDPATKEHWLQSSSNEFARLAQGLGNTKGTDTIFFIHAHQVPKGKKVTYARFVCELRPHKAEIHRTRITVGGNLIEYAGNVSTRTADLTTVKCLLNSTISTPGAKFLCLDIKNFYLGTPVDVFEYMRIPIDLIPENIIQHYNLREKVKDGYIYVEIQQGMYGLPQAGILANKLLQTNLATAGYAPTPHTPGLWKHHTRPVTFSLIVDDFGAKYVGQEHAHHLITALKCNYEISQDWEATLYASITMKWDYKACTVQLSMPGYVEAVLHKFQHPPPLCPQHAPYKARAPQYGVKVQLTDPPDLTAHISPDRIKRLQQILGSLQYYGCAVDLTMLVTLSTLASDQSKATEATVHACNQLLEYCATHPLAILQYQASNMQLKIHSDGAYLCEPRARSRAGGHFYLGNKPDKPEINNGALHTIAAIIKNIMSSAAEAEVASLFLNCKAGAVICTTLKKNLATNKTPHQYKLIIPQPAALSMTQSNSNAPEQWTCISMG
jgi:hypothetical protein